MPSGEVRIDDPPSLPTATPSNPLARIMPLATLVATLGMMAVYLTSGASTSRDPMYLFFPVMMLSSVVGSFAYGSRANRTDEINRARGAYLDYLDGLDAGIVQLAGDQRRSLRWHHPDPDALWTLAGGPRMWERRVGDADFGYIRVGRGDRALSTRLMVPDLDSIEDPVTTTALRTLVDTRSTVVDVPVASALHFGASIAIEGDEARALVRAMICQLAVAHAPDDLAIAAVVDAPSRDEWYWLKWLPHHQLSDRLDAAGPARRVHTTVARAVDAALGPKQLLVVLVDVSSAADLAVGDDRVLVLNVGAASAGESWTVDGGALTLPGAGTIRADGLSRAQATRCARRLAPYRHAASARRAHGWLDLLDIDDPAQLDLDRRWATASDGRLRAVPIGVTEDGAPVHLDINEAARNGMGPHGLCIGATGSGKSEFLRTLVLGMMATHSPEALNLILVDFKGGATFLGFERAHHVAAVITNLAEEAHLVSRMSAALSGEMNRRQELLRTAGNVANLFDYQRARSRGTPFPALPVLFIVVDEFSELLSQHPDFADLFVAIGRVGRSLGMHLLLASQRLDEGRLRGLDTHLSYRICLKTFSASESRAVLGVADAHQLPNAPGAAFLKAPHGDLVRFQTAFVSGPDVRPDATSASPPAHPVVFTAATTPRTEPQHVATASDRTLLETVLHRISGRGTPAHRVWLPPLADPPTLDALMRDTHRPMLTAPIGLVDNPFHQRRDLLLVDVAGAAGNVAVVGAPQSGKSTALRTLLFALAHQRDPAQVQFYCFDFGGGALSALHGMPHVGAVAGRGDVDRCRRTVAVLESVLRAREKRFRRDGIDSIAEYRRRRPADDPFGDVFLVIDGWATLRQEFEALEAPIITLASRGLSYGIHVIVTASRWADLRPALRDQIATRIELRLGDPSDSEMDRKAARLLAGRPPGRGITAAGREFVIALPRFDGTAAVQGMGAHIDAYLAALRETWSGRTAAPIQLLPTRIAHRDLVARYARDTAGPLLGVGERELQSVTVDFMAHQHFVVFGEAGCGKTSTLRLLCREILRTTDPAHAKLEIIDFRRTLLGVVETEHLAGYAMSQAAVESSLRAILDTLTARMPGEHVTQRELRTRSWWSGPDIYLVIDDYDLVAGATGNPLTPLADLVPHANDIGLHLIVARRSSGAARAMFDPVLTRLREFGGAGLMMSAGAEDGVLLGAVRPGPMPAGRGTLVARNAADEVVQVAWIDPP
jgi:S-DNA-T family DNA segregation ATPase FtsK/SpoIIIE